MHSKIKRYEINSNISMEVLEKAKFKKGGNNSKVEYPKMTFSKHLCNNIDLFLEIPIANLSNIKFNDIDNICLLDKNYKQKYFTFYNSDNLSPFLLEVINEYNNTMDSLVKSGVLREKKIIIKK